MRRGSLIFTVALFLVSLLFLKATLAYSFRAKLFPLITLLTVLIFLLIQVIREVLSVSKEKGGTQGGKGDISGTKDLTTWVWMGGTVLMLWVLGFMGTVIFLPFLYLRFQREGWLVSIILPVGCGVFFYGLFGLSLKMPLYPGMIFLKLFG